MTKPDDTRRAIHAPYNPDELAHDFGWLWMDDGPMGPEWTLIHTSDDTDVIFLDDRYPPHDAETWRGTPYLPALPPAIVPGESDALEITVRFAPGSSLVHSFGDHAKARQIFETITTALEMR